MPLGTQRLLMPPLSAEHTATLAEVYADPEVTRYIGGAALDAEGTAAQVVRFEEIWREYGFGQSALLDRGTGAFVGRAGLHPWPQWDEVRARLRPRPARAGPRPRRRGRPGMARRRLHPVGSRPLTAVIHPGNAPSRALATPLGFRVHREDVTPSGVRVLIHERFAC